MAAGIQELNAYQTLYYQATSLITWSAGIFCKYKKWLWTKLVLNFLLQMFHVILKTSRFGVPIILSIFVSWMQLYKYYMQIIRNTSAYFQLAPLNSNTAGISLTISYNLVLYLKAESLLSRNRFSPWDCWLGGLTSSFMVTRQSYFMSRHFDPLSYKTVMCMATYLSSILP